jgi:UDP-N-acetylmuramoyl-tripeptide--D-alanyl-D-alanine ligase
LLFLAFFLPLTIYCLLFVISLLFLWPLDLFVKFLIVRRAKLKIQKFQNLKITIIGIAGSYGKTTMKEMLKQVLGSRLQVSATPESVNTPVGISRWILKNIDSSVQVLIVEMGEHYKGDVEEICNITRPDISVVTGINEAHLERMGNLENTIDTIFEIVSGLKEKGLAVLNGDDANIISNYKKYIWPDQKVARYQVSGISYTKFNIEKLGWDLEVEGLGSVFINLLGEYAFGNVDAVVKIARELGMKNEEIKKGLEKIKPVSHRLEPITSTNGILIIDDAYNGNSKGVSEAIKVLSRFENRRKVFITPGLVETGKAVAEVHRDIGKQLATVADVVILIKNSVTPYIELGIKNYELRMEQDSKLKATSYKLPAIVWFDTAKEAHESLKNILQPNDVVLFQNDWGDQYV